MSVRVMSLVWEHSPLAGTDLLLLLAISDFCDDNGQAYPSRKTLASKTRLDVSTVRRRLRRLEREGHITVHQQAASLGRNMYTIHIGSILNPPQPCAEESPAPQFLCPNEQERAVNNSGRRAVDSGLVGEADRPGGGLPPGTTASLEGAQLRPGEGGTAAPPEPSLTVREPPGAGDRTTATPSQPEESGESRNESTTDSSSIARPNLAPTGDPIAEAVLLGLGRQWPLTVAQRARLAQSVTAAILDGWSVTALIGYLSANPAGVKVPFAVLSARLAELPTPRVERGTCVTRPAWCGRCDEHTRHLERDNGSLERCSACHPLRGS